MGEQKRRQASVVNGTAQGCSGCRYFKRAAGIGSPVGICRSRPPVPLMLGIGKDALGNSQPVIQTYWPQIPDTEWCGDWQAKVDMGLLDAMALENAEVQGEG